MTVAQPARRVLYHVTANPYWLHAAGMLQREYGLEPVYWVQIPRRVPVLRRAFPRVTVHRLYDAFRGILPSALRDRELEPLDAPTIELYTPFESTFLRMVDRLGGPSAFTFGERRRLWRRQLAVWRTVVREMGIDAVVFANTPHNTYDYALYSVATAAGIDTVIGTDTTIDSRVLWRRSVEGEPEGLAACQAKLGNRKNRLPAHVQDYVERVRADYDVAEPEYMRLLRRQDPAWKPTPWAIKAEYIKLPGEPYEAAKITPEGWVAYQEWAIERKAALRAEYEQAAAPADLEQAFIYMPLHFQPERTTCPEAGVYEDQRLMAAMLSAVLPEGWKLYVREHPSQFSPALFGEMGRDDHLYFDLSRMGNVQLVPMSTSPFELIDSSLAVATATGTAGWEALVRGRPALVFGNAWYQRCFGATRVRTNEDLADALGRLEASRPKPRDVEAFVAAVLECGVPMPSSIPPVTGELQRIARRLADAVAELLMRDTMEGER